MTTIIMRMDALERDYDFVKTGTYRKKTNKMLYSATFDNGLVYLESYGTKRDD